MKTRKDGTVDMCVTVSRLSEGHADRANGVYFASWQDISAYGNELTDVLRELAAKIEYANIAEDCARCLDGKPYKGYSSATAQTDLPGTTRAERQAASRE